MKKLSSQLFQLNSVSLRVQARQAIRASIIIGEIEVDEIYPTSYFASRLGVSATPVREALLDLASDGLIEAVPNRGFRVPKLSEHDLDEIFQLRLMLEVPSVMHLARNKNKEDIKECRILSKQVKKYAELEEVDAFLQADRTFHRRLLESLGNSRLVKVVMQMRDQARLVGLSHLTEPGLLMSAVQEHEEILDAVEHGQAKRAGEVMRSHLVHTRGVWAGHPEDNDIDGMLRYLRDL